MSRRGIAASVALALAGLLAWTATATGATRYAAPTGSGAEPCADDDAPCSIEDAVEGGTVMAGDVVVLLPGTYALGAGDAVGISEDITVGGQAGQPRPLITSSDSGAVGINAPGVGTPVLRDVEIIHTGSSAGLFIEGGTAERVLVSSAGTSACTVFSHSGVDGLIRDSVCRNTAGGAAVGGSWGGPLSSTGRLRNVTAISLAPGGIGIDIRGTGNGGATIEGVNVIARGGATDAKASDDGSLGASGTVTFANSNFSTRDESGPSTVTDPLAAGNQTAPPLFVNAASGDFHQQATSPTVNAGIADALLGASDIDGAPRVQEGLPDIGADEFTPTAAPPAPGPPTAAPPKKKCKKKTKKKGKAAAKKKGCKKKRKKR